MSADRGRPRPDVLAGDARAALVAALREGRAVRFVARGNSMWPRVRDGALLEVVPCPWTELEPGALAAVERAAGVCVHRVIAREAAGLRCRGDAREAADPLAPPASVLGRARVLSQPTLRIRQPRAADVVALWRAARALLRLGAHALRRLRASLHTGRVRGPAAQSAPERARSSA